MGKRFVQNKDKKKENNDSKNNILSPLNSLGTSYPANFRMSDRFILNLILFHICGISRILLITIAHW